MDKGYKTSEFWLTLLSNLIGAGGTLSGLIPVDLGVALVGFANGCYALLRTVLKMRNK